MKKIKEHTRISSSLNTSHYTGNDLQRKQHYNIDYPYKVISSSTMQSSLEAAHC